MIFSLYPGSSSVPNYFCCVKERKGKDIDTSQVSRDYRVDLVSQWLGAAYWLCIYLLCVVSFAAAHMPGLSSRFHMFCHGIDTKFIMSTCRERRPSQLRELAGSRRNFFHVYPYRIHRIHRRSRRTTLPDLAIHSSASRLPTTTSTHIHTQTYSYTNIYMCWHRMLLPPRPSATEECFYPHRTSKPETKVRPPFLLWTKLEQWNQHTK